MADFLMLTTFLGWCTILNLAILMLSAFLVVAFRDCIINIHSKMFDIKAEKLPKIYFKYLANYKIAIITFNLVPYLALKIMA